MKKTTKSLHIKVKYIERSRKLGRKAVKWFYHNFVLFSDFSLPYIQQKGSLTLLELFDVRLSVLFFWGGV